MSEQRNPVVEHDEAERQFVIRQKEGNSALCYEYIKPDAVDLQHTEVHASQRGKGYGDILAQAALNFALRNKLKVRLSCSFLKYYFAKNSLSKSTFRIIK